MNIFNKCKKRIKCAYYKKRQDISVKKAGKYVIGDKKFEHWGRNYRKYTRKLYMETVK